MCVSARQSILFTFLSLQFSAAALGQLETPQASPTGTIGQKVGIMNVSVEYSRPGMKGRTIFGGLVPYGEVWRTGANEATKVTFSDDVKLEGHSLAAGTYALYTIPGEDEWTIIINQKMSWGTQYDAAGDVLRFQVKPGNAGRTIETFTISIGDITDNSATMELAWDHTLVRFGMEFDVEAKVMAQIESFAKNPLGGVSGSYYQAANFYFNHGKDLNQALEWVNKSLEISTDRYWVWRLKAQIQAGLNDYEGAIATAGTARMKAEEAGNQQFVKYNEDSIAEWSKMR